MKGILPLLFAAVLGSANAQTSFQIVPGTVCGTATPILFCTFDFLPAVPPLLDYRYANLASDLAANLDNKNRGMEFGNFPVNGKYLSEALYQVDQTTHMYRIYETSALVCDPLVPTVCSTQVVAFAAYMEGGYVGGETFTGLLTAHFEYRVTIQQGGTYLWTRYLRSAAHGGAGAITIN